MTTTFIDSAKLGLIELTIRALMLKQSNDLKWYEWFYRAIAVQMYIEYAETFTDSMFTDAEYNHIEFKIRDIIDASIKGFSWENTTTDDTLPSGDYRVTVVGDFRILNDESYRIV